MNLPAQMEHLFANYQAGAVDPDKHPGLVIRTVLARGTWDQVKWLFRYYGKDAVGEAFRKDYYGLRTLPKPTLRLWETLFIEHVERTSDPLDRWRCRRRPVTRHADEDPQL